MSEDLIFYYPVQELRDIERIFFERKEQLALDRINEFLSRTDLDEEAFLQGKIIKSYILEEIVIIRPPEEKTLESLELAEEVFNRSEQLKNPLLAFDALTMIYRNYQESVSFGHSYIPENKIARFNELIDRLPEKLELIEPKDEMDYLVRKAFYLFLQPWIRIRRGDIEKSDFVESWKRSAELCKKNDFKRILMYNTGSLAIHYRNKGEFEKALSYYEESLDVSKRMGYLLDIGERYNHLAYFYRAKKDYENFYKYTQKYLEICEELDWEEGIYDAIFNIGTYYLDKGEHAKSIIYFEKSMSMCKDEYYLPMILAQIGKVHENEGNLNKAHDKYLEAYDMASKHKNTEYWHMIVRYLASVRFLLGDLDSALEYIDEAISAYSKGESYIFVAEILDIKSNILWYKGLKEEAICLLEEGLVLAEKFNLNDMVAKYLSILVRFCYEIDSVNKAEIYYTKIIELKELVKHKPSKHRILLAEINYLFRSTILKEKIRAEVISEQLLVEEEIEYPILIDVLLILTEYLFKEFKATEKEEYLNRLNKYTEQLQKITKDKKSTIIQIQVLILQSKLQLLTLDINQSRSLLFEALRIAQENKLENLIQTILFQQERISAEAIMLEKLKVKTTKISERVEIIEIQESFEEIKKSAIDLQLKHTI